MRRSSRFKRGLLMLALLTGLVLVPTAAQADSSFYDSPIFGVATDTDGTLLVADYPNGIVNGDTGALVASLPEVQDIASRGGGKLWAITAGADPLTSSNQSLYSIEGGVATKFADLFAFEEDKNPHPFAVDSNPFDVLDAGRGEAYVTDAGGNDLLHVKRFGNVKLIAVLPDDVVSSAHGKSVVGCPNAAPAFAWVCGLPDMMPAQAVATSVAIGPDGWFYVGELKGAPAPKGESRVWRIRPNANNVRCGKSPRCQVALDGFTSVIDLAFGPDGRLYVAQIDDESWLAMEAGTGVGGSVQACNLTTKVCEKVVSGVPMLTAITFREDGSLWGTTSSLVPGAADVIQLLP